MKVLVGVDGSASGFAALRLASRMLNPQHDQIALYYAPPTIHVQLQNELDDSIPERARQALLNSVFDEARSRLPESFSDSITTVQGEKRAGHGIIVAADELRADLIVVGKRGLGRFERLLVGSVARAVVHESTIPVLVVKPMADIDANRGIRVLLACDGSASSQRAGAMLHRFTWPSGSVGQVIRVVESLFGNEIPEWLEQQARQESTEVLARAWTQQRDDVKRSTGDQLAGYCDDLPDIFREHPPLVTEGHPTKEILKAIDSHHCDLVVMGARQSGKISRILLGSTSEFLLGHAPCSVLVVREHEHP